MNKIAVSFLVLLTGVVLQGCVAIPPLIQVQHRDSGSNNLSSRLDSIERRLDQLEQKSASQAK
jgi:hypothetical protein